MANSSMLIASMAEQCLDLIRQRDKTSLDLPTSLQPQHLQWMCQEIVKHARDWPVTKSHRWLGFVEGAMIANRIINLDGAKAMFDRAKNAYGEVEEDLLDHLNPDHPFEFDIGGQG